MKMSSGYLCLVLSLSGVFGSLCARAATPTMQTFTASSVVVGENVTLRADVADADGNLQSVIFYISGPGISGWLTVGSRAVAGAAASAEITWTAPRTGIFTARADVVDPTTGSSLQRVLEVFVERRTVASTTIASGKNVMYTSAGELVARENQTAPSVVASSGSSLILWAAGRLILKPGFRAESGSFFWGAVDHNMNGYSDVEEVTDTDGDGIFDAWEVDHGLNPVDPTDAGRIAPGQIITNLQAFQTGKDPRDANYATPLPPGFNLVLKTPANQFLGVSVSTWAITPL